MTTIQISQLSKSYGTVKAISQLDLTVDEGELLVLLGPSGCGKTTTLRCVAGLEAPDGGVITLGERVVNDAASRRMVPPEKRDIGIVFQSYALWPHMTVSRNVAYPLQNAHVDSKARDSRIREITDLVECGQLLTRYPSQLSGGQQQRVALARALAAWPAIMLFDEPLSNLDQRLRANIRSELRRLKEQLGFTGIYVTHDQEEALHVGDKIAVMDLGRLIQIGTPREVFDQPETKRVAEFLGGETTLNLVKGADGWWAGATAVQIIDPRVERWSEISIVLRPDRMILWEQAEHRAALMIEGIVLQARYLGAAMDYVVDASGTEFRVRGRVDAPFRPNPGDHVIAATDQPLLYGQDGVLLH